MRNSDKADFDLRLLRLKDILLHENLETKRFKKVYSRLKRNKYLINPLIVGRIDDSLVLIDGANRYSALKKIGCELILAQVIDYQNEANRLDKWNHLVFGLSIEELIEFCEKSKLKYQQCSMDAVQIFSNSNKILATDMRARRSLCIDLSDRPSKMIAQLNGLTQLYFGKHRFERCEPSADYFQDADLDCQMLLIQFPDFSKEQIIEVAKGKRKIPAGITRHILRNRVLRIMFPISELKSEKSVKKKTKKLNAVVLDKIRTQKLRQYSEPVIVFDD